MIVGDAGPPASNLRLDGLPLNEQQVQRAVRKFRQLLKRAGKRSMDGREAIARVVLEREGCFDVNDIWLKLRQENIPASGIFAVHRTLPMLVEAGLIRPLRGSTTERRLYVVTFERPEQCDLICLSCGKVIETGCQELIVLHREMARRFDFELCPHAHELLGKCSACR